MSGHPLESAPFDGIRDGRFALLQKPPTPDTLAEKANLALDGPPGP